MNFDAIVSTDTSVAYDISLFALLTSSAVMWRKERPLKF
jgi:hypothetical protein